MLKSAYSFFNYLKKQYFDQVITSRLHRTQQTAQYVQAQKVSFHFMNHDILLDMVIKQIFVENI